MSEQMREEFEGWAAEEAEVRGVGSLLGLMKDEHHDRYSMIWTQTAWVAWQASREALVIEFPNRYDEKYQEYFDDVDGGCFNAAKYLADVKSTIEAAGLKVTP
ncbi:hypothetical protein [Pseudomonas crudilactis]|uniref:hypothetical protein n=1 Tax=Pseudomonas crudilactis TaxID=2697028 RepID=UPI001C5C9328|nr:hypothetical protein [Pseudomonas crudilactis]